MTCKCEVISHCQENEFEKLKEKERIYVTHIYVCRFSCLANKEEERNHFNTAKENI